MPDALRQHAHPRIRIFAAGRRVGLFSLKRSCTLLGRGRVQIRLRSRHLSPTHLYLHRLAPDWVVAEPASPVQRDGVELKGPTRLRQGDRLVIGPVELEVELQPTSPLTRGPLLGPRDTRLQLLVRNGSGSQLWPLERSLELGRSPSVDIQLDEEDIPERALRLTVDKRGLRYVSLDLSHPPPMLNGIPLSSGRLRMHDRLELAGLSLFLLEAPDSGAHLVHLPGERSPSRGDPFCQDAAWLHLAPQELRIYQRDPETGALVQCGAVRPQRLAGPSDLDDELDLSDDLLAPDVDDEGELLMDDIETADYLVDDLPRLG